MAEITDTQILENLKAALAAREVGDGTLDGFFDFLAESERYLRFNHPEIANPKTPLENPDEGSREFGLVLFLLKYPTPELTEWLDGNEIMKTVWDTLIEEQRVGNQATTNLTTTDYNLLIATPYVGGDGTIWGTATYEQLDLTPGWLISALNYVINLLVGTHGFVTDPYSGTLSGAGDAGPIIAIIGDWGTGKFETGYAEEIMDQVRGLNPPPDYIIHLGDVYYAGTDDRPVRGEEQDNFLNHWGNSPPKTAFTLNSNHEMYGNGTEPFGGSGIYDVALGKTTPFAHQNQTTYFSLEFGPWVILGLDSAFYSDKANGLKFYMDGAIGDEDNHEQANWIAGLNIASDKKVIVMTHHNPIDYTGAASSSTAKLLSQVNAALDNKAPDYWYWGHIHLGASYKSNAACAPTLGRCVGHGAIPFGIPWGLEGKHTWDYYSHTVDLNIPGGFRVLNGFMTIQLNSDGTLNEAWYEQGNPNPVWPK